MAPTKAQQEAREEQFPSLSDQQKVEIAERSQDVDAVTASEHRKDFVLVKRQIDNRESLDDIHENNIRATRQYMVSQGLRPASEGRFVERVDHPDGLSVTLTYAVKAIPAVVARDEKVVHASADPDQKVTVPAAERADVTNDGKVDVINSGAKSPDDQVDGDK